MHKIGVFIRCAYDKPIPDERLLLFQETINSLKKQLFKEFDVYVITGGIWKQNGAYANTKRIQTLDWRNLSVLFLHNDNIPKYHYSIQVRLDSDDWISPCYILKCVDIYQQTKKQNFIITFLPYFAKDGYFYIRENDLRKKPSTFSVLCQKREIRHWCYEVPHTKLSEVIPDVVVVEAGFCVANVHNRNMSTCIFKTDRKLGI